MSTIASDRIDLPAYFARIGYSGTPRTSLETLRDLHLAHATHVPFENLDVILGRPIRLDLPSLERKLVAERRGGYCYEQNLLFAAVLRQLGFSVDLLQARVRFGTQRVIPRTHVALAVQIGGESWLADLGFGSYGLLHPLPLVPGDYRQFDWSYQLVREGEAWVLRGPVAGVWQDLYVFNLEPQLAVDFELGNHYVSTHPDSRFVQTLTVQRISVSQRLVLRNTILTTTTLAGESQRSVAGDDELLHLLSESFGLSLPAGTRLLPATSPRLEPPK